MIRSVPEEIQPIRLSTALPSIAFAAVLTTGLWFGIAIGETPAAKLPPAGTLPIAVPDTLSDTLPEEGLEDTLGTGETDAPVVPREPSTDMGTSDRQDRNEREAETLEEDTVSQSAPEPDSQPEPATAGTISSPPRPASVMAAPAEPELNRFGAFKARERMVLFRSPGLPAPGPDTAAWPMTLRLGGMVHFKGLYHDMFSASDDDKDLSFMMGRAAIELDAGFADRFGFFLGLRSDSLVPNATFRDAYLFARVAPGLHLRAGKFMRPVSPIAITHDDELPVIERGRLYFGFLSETLGYLGRDLGVAIRWQPPLAQVPVEVEVGLFNGAQSPFSSQGYAQQEEVVRDAGFKGKDATFRIRLAPLASLMLEAGVSTKGVDKPVTSENFDLAVSTAYLAGAGFRMGGFGLALEAAYGQNHMGSDRRIVEATSTDFLAFYAMPSWRVDYPAGRAMELVFQLQGLDPDISDTGLNDGTMAYTVLANAFFNRHMSLQLSYGVEQPITAVTSEDRLIHNAEALWRFRF